MKVILLGLAIVGICIVSPIPEMVTDLLEGVFSGREISRIESTIRQHYEADGNHVDEVVMVKDHDSHLSGFVTFEKPGPLGMGRFKVTMNCTATRETTGQYSWECKPRSL